MSETRFHGVFPYLVSPIDATGEVKAGVLAGLCGDLIAEPFCMTVMALKTSRAANAVSELHGHVSRKMWHGLHPDRPVDEVPIGHITNGIHLLGWMKGPVRTFWKRKLGPRWDEEINGADYWQLMLDPAFVSDEELWALRYRLRRALIEFVRRRAERQGQRLAQSDFIAFDRLLDPDALPIGFARRFAAYKRAPLVFQDLDRITKLALDADRPIQFIFAGKAHPMDDEGKRHLRRILQLAKNPAVRGRIVFVENYDVHVARQMVSGCDIWLNNPRRPMEASGRELRRDPLPQHAQAVSTSACRRPDGGVRNDQGRRRRTQRTARSRN